MLTRIDTVLQIASAILFLVLAGRWLRRGRLPFFHTAPPRPNRLREDAVVLPVLAYFASFVILGSVLGVFGEVKPATGYGLALGWFAQFAGAVACIVLAAQHFEGGAVSFLKGPPGHGAGNLVAASATWLLAVGICPLVLEVTTRVVWHFDPNHEFPMHSTIEMLRDADRTPLLVAALWGGAVIMAPIAEELFFRGILQSAILNATRSRAAAIAVSSVAFALAHTQQAHTIPALIVLAVMLGFVYERTGALWPCIVVHAAFNLKTLIWDALGAR